MLIIITLDSIGRDSVEFATSLVYLGTEVSNTGDIFTETIRKRWLQVSWQSRKDNYSNVATSHDAPRYEFTTPPSFLFYYTAPRRGLLVKPSTPAFMSSSPARSRGALVRYCTNVVLRRETGQPNITRTITQWLGHVRQQPDGHHISDLYQIDPKFANWRRHHARLRCGRLSSGRLHSR